MSSDVETGIFSGVGISDPSRHRCVALRIEGHVGRPDVSVVVIRATGVFIA
jgi:hypothetical protein